MNNREYIKGQTDTLPDNVIKKIQEFINDTDYLNAIPGMTESILEGKATPIIECLDSVGWNIPRQATKALAKWSNPVLNNKSEP